MALSKKKIEGLLEMVAQTRDDEIDCDACLSGISAFAENELAGKPVAEVQRAIERHLATCPECEREYRTLLAAIRALDEE